MIKNSSSLSEMPRGRSVLHIHWAFPPTTGGVESHLADLAPALVEHGWRVTILTGEEKPIDSPTYEVISTPLLNLTRIRDQTCSPREDVAPLQTLIGRLISMRGVEILHGHNLHHFSPAPALAIERLRQTFRLRVHHTFHETWPDILSREPVYRDWDGNYAISQYIQNQCRDLIGFRPNVLHPGVDTARFLSSRNCFSDSSIATILHPARLLPWKGVHISIQMLRLVLDAGFNARLIITDTQKIADWNRQLIIYREEILRLIAELHLEKYVKLVRATFADMPRLYNSADIVVYPTIAGEPYGLVPPEAMSCGRPVVASRCGGIPETVVHGVTGFLVDPGDVAALAQGVVLLLRDHSLAQRLGAAGRSRVKECFSTQKHISALLNRYGPAEDEA